MALTLYGSTPAYRREWRCGKVRILPEATPSRSVPWATIGEMFRDRVHTGGQAEKAEQRAQARAGCASRMREQDARAVREQAESPRAGASRREQGDFPRDFPTIRPSKGFQKGFQIPRGISEGFWIPGTDSVRKATRSQKVHHPGPRSLRVKSPSSPHPPRAARPLTPARACSPAQYSPLAPASATLLAHPARAGSGSARAYPACPACRCGVQVRAFGGFPITGFRGLVALSWAMPDMRREAGRQGWKELPVCPGGRQGHGSDPLRNGRDRIQFH